MTDRPGLEEYIQTIDMLSGAEDAIESNTESAPKRITQRYLAFRVGPIDFAVRLGDVREVLDQPVTTRLPLTPAWVAGLCNVRGDVVSVTETAALLGIDSDVHGDDRKMVVLHSSKCDVTSGLLVDRVLGIRHIAEDQKRSTSTMRRTHLTPFLSGVAHSQDDILSLLDIDLLFESRLMLGR